MVSTGSTLNEEADSISVGAETQKTRWLEFEWQRPVFWAAHLLANYLTILGPLGFLMCKMEVIIVLIPQGGCEHESVFIHAKCLEWYLAHRRCSLNVR